MRMEIPYDIIISILSNSYSDSSSKEFRTTLANTSLVSHAFLPPSRRHLFKTISLNQYEVGPFLKLVEDKHETISLANIEGLRIAQNMYQEEEDGANVGSLHSCKAFNRLLMWECEHEEKKKSVLNLFGQLKYLSINWVGLWTLEDEAKRRLQESSKEVKELALWEVGFESYPQFREFIASFPSLETLSLEVLQRFGTMVPTNGTSGSGISPTLKTIKLKAIEDPQVIEELVPCSLLKELSVHFYNFDDFTPRLGQAIGALVLSAGESLEKLSISIQAAGLLNDGTVLDNSFKNVIFSSTPNLRFIILSIEDGPYIVPFLRRLSSFSLPKLEVIEITELQRLASSDGPPAIDWKELDRLTSESGWTIKANVYGSFYPEDVEGQPGGDPAHYGGYMRPNDGSDAAERMKEDTENFKKKLPRLVKKGCVKLEEQWSFSSGDWDR